MEILDLIAKVSWETNQQALDGISKEMHKQDTLLEELRNKGRRLNDQMVRTNDPKKIKAINDELQKTRKQVESITSAQQKQADMTTKLRDRQKELVKELQKVNDPKAVQGLLRSLHQVDNQLSALTTKAKDMGSKFSGIGQSLLAGFGLGAGMVGLDAVIRGFTGVISDAFAEAEDAARISGELEQTLSRIGKGGYFSGLVMQAEALAEQFHGLFDNDEIVQAQKQLIQYGKITRRELSELLPVILELAAAEKIGLEEATTKIVNILEGKGGPIMRQYGLTVKGVKTEHERLQLVLTDFYKKVKGSADELATTTQGLETITRNSLAGMEEELGNKLLPLKRMWLELKLYALDAFMQGSYVGNAGESKEDKYKAWLKTVSDRKMLARMEKFDAKTKTPEELAAEEEAAKKAAEEEQKRREAYLKGQEELNKELTELRRSLYAYYLSLDDQEIASVNEKYEKLKARAIQFGGDIAKIEELRQEALTQLKQKFAKRDSGFLSDIGYAKQGSSQADAAKIVATANRDADIVWGLYWEEFYKQQRKIKERERILSQARNPQAFGDDQQKLFADSMEFAKQVSSVYQIEIAEIDRLISKQQERVDAAKESSDASLKIEQRRLDELTTKRARYERQQRALDSAVMLANQAMAFSNAIVGVSAAVKSGNAVLILANIAAVLGSLVGGYAAVRGLANQSKGFMEGGYTGDGDPTETSTALGNRGYKYHKREFVMKEALTEKHRDMFEGMHKGRLIAKKIGNSWMIMPKGIDVDAAVADHHSVRAEYNTANMEAILFSIDRRLQHREVRVENNFDAEGFSTNIAAKLGRISIIDKMRNS